ncbi:START domain-containing protein 10-like [Pecten maximus]|uniref:START domain-containing protein 10-like n=1 Tax=Pecten maximus TaxID=6579 RepID=UPI001458A5A3|nr:START domain-containing protein 10-like [Pecten maximus]
MQVGEVRVAEDADFKRLKTLCDEKDGWKQEYNKNNTCVWTKNNDVSDFKIIKVRTLFTDVKAEVLYDVLHDPHYRKTWDMSMLEGYEICALNPNNDIGYYAMKCPSPLKNRDFVTQRSWLDLGSEFCILNHSVNHASVPARKGFIRGVSYITGFLIRKMDTYTCQFNYVSHSDPKGKLPVWAVNKATQIMAPKVMSRIYKACKNYEAWKSMNNPRMKPWLYPEQMTLPRLDMTQIKPASEFTSTESIDESFIKEDEINEDDV